MDLSEELATIHYFWTPAQPGRYVISARTQNEAGDWSEPHTHIVVLGETTVTLTDMPTTTFTPTITPTGTSTTTPTSTPGIIFSNLRLSSNIFYRLDQVPMKVTFTVKVVDPAGIKIVGIYFRLRDLNTGETTPGLTKA
jgi:hypothetical protein